MVVLGVAISLPLLVAGGYAAGLTLYVLQGDGNLQTGLREVAYTVLAVGLGSIIVLLPALLIWLIGTDSMRAIAAGISLSWAVVLIGGLTVAAL